MNLVVRPAAAADLEHAYRWYEAQQAGLGRRFLQAVESGFAVLIENPGRYPVVHRDARRMLLRGFPYSLLNRVSGETVVVVACFHGSRNPRFWKRRR